MKVCPRCGSSYSDPSINFCLNDGELLRQLSGEDDDTVLRAAPLSFSAEPPPTQVLNDPRMTRESNWPTHPIQYQSPFPAAGEPALYPTAVSPNQTLPIVSFSLGITSIVIGWCCSLGLLTAPVSIVLGVIALSQIKANPEAYSGRPLAIAGIALSSIFFALYVILILVYGFASWFANTQ